jgi:hypothetical protein
MGLASDTKMEQSMSLSSTSTSFMTAPYTSLAMIRPIASASIVPILARPTCNLFSKVRGRHRNGHLRGFRRRAELEGDFDISPFLLSVEVYARQRRERSRARSVLPVLSSAGKDQQVLLEREQELVL